jgi:hypothetical protein
MAIGTEKPILVTLIGNVDFDGLTDTTGLIVFPPQDRHPSPSRAIVHSLSLLGVSGSTIKQADVWIGRPPPNIPVTTPLQHPRRWEAPSLSTIPQDIYWGCGLVIPPNYAMSFTTGSKTGTGTLIVDWSPVQPGSGCIDTAEGFLSTLGPPT